VGSDGDLTPPTPLIANNTTVTSTNLTPNNYTFIAGTGVSKNTKLSTTSSPNPNSPTNNTTANYSKNKCRNEKGCGGTT
jgi:hypothetical protein